MPPTVSNPENSLNKFQRYRMRKSAKGMRLLRIWVPDPHAPGFRAEVQRQAALLHGTPEEIEALEFIEAAADREG